MANQDKPKAGKASKTTGPKPADKPKPKTEAKPKGKGK
jgi:hypothetical protein